MEARGTIYGGPGTIYQGPGTIMEARGQFMEARGRFMEAGGQLMEARGRLMEAWGRFKELRAKASYTPESAGISNHQFEGHRQSRKACRSSDPEAMVLVPARSFTLAYFFLNR